MLRNSLDELKAEIVKSADRCVKCGLCSAQCPTYLVNQTENESPRGRISMMQAIASDQLPITTQLIEPIESCLSCYRCEKVCPSGVEFGELMANTRHLINQSNPDFKKEMLVKWASKLSLTKWKSLAKFILAIGSLGLFRFFPQLKLITNHIKPAISSAQNQQRENEVYLFTGCTSQLLDARTIQTAYKLLNLCDYSVIAPENQVCCGALSHHKGYLEIAQQCHKDNQEAFQRSTLPIVFLATACGAELKKYGKPISTQAINITNFLVDHNLLDTLRFTPIKKRVLVHTPCSEKNTGNKTGDVEKLLSHLPNIEIFTLKESTSCCGAAGDYMLNHRDNSNRIRALLINDIKTIKPDIIVTSNYTCGIHIKNGLKKINLDIAVMHPIELLFNQINRPNQESSHA